MLGNTVESSVKKKIQEISERKKLEGIKKIDIYKGIYTLETINGSRVIIQPMSLDVQGESIVVYFIRDWVDNDSWEKSFFLQLDNTNWNENNPVPTYEVEAFLQNYKQTQYSIQSKESPPQELTDWFPDFSKHFRLAFDVYETEDWVRFANQDIEKEGMREKDIAIFRFALIEIVDRRAKPIVLKQEKGYSILEYTYQNIGLIYTEITENNNTSCLLYGGANTNEQKDYWKTIKDKIINTPQSEIINTEDMRKQAVRAYPSWTLKQDELWDKIQRSSESSNYSLLTEQIDFLKSFKFPCYINGQAGSGKSTMLYYLFANAYYFQGVGLIKDELIFLTENSELLHKTKIAIRNLLANNTNFNLNTISDFDNFDTCFATFKDFLWEVLQAEDQKNSPNTNI